jgi:hypothetical protein
VRILKGLRDNGNTVVVVELIRIIKADNILIWVRSPGKRRRGGVLGPHEKILRDKHC